MRLVDATKSERQSAVRDDRAQLFRAEALSHYQRGRDSEAHVLELEPKWTRYASHVIAGLFLAAVVFAAIVPIQRHARGVGVVRGGRLIVVVPARYATELRPSMPLRFEPADEQLAVDSVGTTTIGSSEARRLLGPDTRWTSAPAVVVEAPLDDGRWDDGLTGDVRILLGRERLLQALVSWSRRG